MADVIRMAPRGRKPQPELYGLLWDVMADADLTPTAKCVFSVLILKIRNRETGLCNPSFKTMAASVGLSRRTAFNAIGELKAAGWIEAVGTKGGATSNTNRYIFPKLLAGDTGEADCTPTGEADCTRRGAKYDTRGEPHCTPGVNRTAHDLSLKPSNNHSGAGARASANAGSGGADSKRASDGSGSPCLVTPGTPAFDAWLAHFEQLRAEKMLKHMRNCMASGEAVSVRSPLPPSRASSTGADGALS